MNKKEKDWKIGSIIKYDPKADILTMKIREGAIANEKLLDNDVLLATTKTTNS